MYYSQHRRRRDKRLLSLVWSIKMTKVCTGFFMISAIATTLLSFDYNAVAQSTDSKVSLGFTLTGNQSILSKNGQFHLGFFKTSGSSSSYLGIWYTLGSSQQTVVWVANRNQPATGSASTFSLSLDGELKVSNSDNSVVWSSGTRGMNVAMAVLMDSGNLVLQSENSTSVWESFNHPTNVWLLDMEFRLGMKLISWKTPIDPAEGPYINEMLETGEIVSLWNGSKQYYSSGMWNGKAFNNVPEMKDTMLNFSFDPKSGLTWSLRPSDSNYKSAWLVLETNGQVKLYLWMEHSDEWTQPWSQPTNPCDVYATCGEYGVCNSSSSEVCSCPSGFEDVDPVLWRSRHHFSGCKRQTPIICSAEGSNDVFLMLKNTSFDTEGLSPPNLGITESQCRRSCLRDCSCAAYHYDQSAKNCSLESKVLWVSSLFSSGAINLRVSAQQFSRESRPGGRKKMCVRIVVGTIVGVAVVIVIILVVLMLRRNGAGTRGRRRCLPGVLHRFSYKQLQSATRNFKDPIGSGGFGSVFKGVLPDMNAPVAVKRLRTSDQSEKQFRTEVSTIGIIQHVNLVRLLGFSSERSHRLLVLEHMANGSLDRFLFRGREAPNKRILDWSTRFQIAMGTARAIAYLHEGCRECIIHCDIKPENILLDANFCAKLSDFGLAKLVGREFSHVLTSMRGTRGYLAPEWIAGLPITAKADVYSFGMTLLEIISGERNMGAMVGSELNCFFPVWAAMKVSKEREVMGLVDGRLEGRVEEEEVRRAAYTAVWCIQDEEEARPRMGEVVRMLEGTLHPKAPPMPFSLGSMADDHIS